MGAAAWPKDGLLSGVELLLGAIGFLSGGEPTLAGVQSRGDRLDMGLL